MKRKFGVFEIEYTTDDFAYIDKLVEELEDKYLNIMEFFNLQRLEHTVNIKIWNNLEEYRNYFSKKINRKIPNWEVARATINKNESRIDLLSLKERVKCEGHQEDNLDNLLKVIIHEFVHICHITYNNYRCSMVWFGEGLATNLSNQFTKSEINCSLDDILNGKAQYINYYSMVKYLLDNFSKDYILGLAKDKALLEKETKDIYYKTIEYIKNAEK